MTISTKTHRRGAAWLALAVLAMATLPACNAPDADRPQGVSDGSILAPGTPGDTTPPPGNDPTPENPDLMTVAVKYVALQQTATTSPSPTQDAVVTVLANMSKYWAQCDIEFKLEEYLAPVASDHGLDYTPANQSDHTAMRAEFDDGKHALFIKTGSWDRSGNLGNDGSNGFSTMPPADPEGFVVEAGVATHTLLLSHEAGHLIGGLGHTSTSTNLMNHFVTTSTTLLTDAQCAAARDTMWDYHAAWIR